MNKRNYWIHMESKIARILGKSGEWPPGYLRFVLRGNKLCFEVFTHLTRAERLFLYTTALRLPKGHCMVEIGSYLGASSCFLAAAAKEKKGFLYCVDTWKNEGMTEGPRDTYETFLSNTRRYRNLIEPIRLSSKEAASNFSHTIDLLFIDGDHNYENVRTDLKSWLPKLSSGGILLMHDWGWAEGVKRAIGEIVVPLQVNKPVTLANIYATRVK